MDGEIHNHDYFPSTTATSTALGATSIHITALDGIINVNSLFTLAIFIGISYNPSDPTSITSSSCFPSIHVAESMVSFHVYSFSSFLLSSLIALCLKQGIRILPHPPHGTRAAKVNKRLLRVGILGSAVGSVCGCGFLMMALVCLVQVKLGKFECGGATVGAVIPLVTLIPAAMLVYMASTSTTATSQPFANWTDDRESAFIDVCVEFIAERNTSVSGFYATVATTMNNRFNLEFTENQIKNKWDNMKRAFRNWDMLLRTPGGVWNEEFDYLDGPDEFWSTGGGRRFRKFRKHSPMKFRDQDIMFEGCLRKDTCAYPIPQVAPPTAPAPPPAPAAAGSFSHGDASFYTGWMASGDPPSG